MVLIYDRLIMKMSISLTLIHSKLVVVLRYFFLIISRLWLQSSVSDFDFDIDFRNGKVKVAKPKKETQAAVFSF